MAYGMPGSEAVLFGTGGGPGVARLARAVRPEGCNEFMSNRSARPGTTSSHTEMPPSALKLMQGTAKATPPIASPYRLVKARRGTMLVNANDVYMGQAYLRYGECCEVELSLLLQLLGVPGMIIEVGANMGIHTIPMAAELARQGREMLALEPQPVIFQQLCANLAVNGLMNVTALPYACGKRGGMVSFEVPDYRVVGNFGGTPMSSTLTTGPEGAARREHVPCIRLDDLVGEAFVGLVKIDVEGFEVQVLEGCVALMERCRPLMYVENDRPAQSPELISWLWDHGYQLWWHIPPLFNPNNIAGVKENIYGNTCSFNILCIPEPNELAIEGMTRVVDRNAHPLLPRS